MPLGLSSLVPLRIKWRTHPLYPFDDHVTHVMSSQHAQQKNPQLLILMNASVDKSELYIASEYPKTRSSLLFAVDMSSSISGWSIVFFAVITFIFSSSHQKGRQLSLAGQRGVQLLVVWKMTATIETAFLHLSFVLYTSRPGWGGRTKFSFSKDVWRLYLVHPRRLLVASDHTASLELKIMWGHISFISIIQQLWQELAPVSSEPCVAVTVSALPRDSAVHWVFSSIKSHLCQLQRH